MRKILLIAFLLMIGTIAIAAMSLTQIKSAHEVGDVVYYAPAAYYEYFAGDRADLPHAPFSAITKIPSGKIDQISVMPVYDIGTDTWTDTITISINGQTLPSSRLYTTQDGLKATLKTALATHSIKLQAMVALNTTYIASVDEIGVPVLLTSVEVLDFGDIETELSFSISNDGDGKLDYTITTSLPAKVTVNPVSGSSIDDTDNIVVTVDRSGIAPGTYNPTVDISSDGGSATIVLTVVVP